MTGRTRFISGLATLAAMSFSLVESVWASTCDPTMEMAAVPAAEQHGSEMSMDEMDMGMDMTLDMGGKHDCPPIDTEGGRGADRHGADCPFGLPGSPQGCAAAASLPASTATVSLVSDHQERAIRPVESGPLAPSVGSIFHPPKA